MLSSGQTGSPGAAVTPVVSHGPFGWPLSPRPAVLRPFDRPADQWSPGHRGVDLSAGVGQPVVSAGEGIVSFSGVVAGRGVLTVQHSGGLRTTYEPVDERLASGTIVHRGTKVGVLSSEPGHCTPRGCLHWGAISGQGYRDPLSLLGFGPPILLPLG
jgi:murein DD-endopeptidase MepM/ murein hydrolase activator NlpD